MAAKAGTPGTGAQNGLVADGNGGWYDPAFYNLQNGMVTQNNAAFNNPNTKASNNPLANFGANPADYPIQNTNIGKPGSTFASSQNQTPSPGNLTVSQTSGGTAGTPFLPTMYNGQLYNDPHSLAQAVIQGANDGYSQALKNAQTAYQQGLVTFQQMQQTIDQSRQTLGQQLGNDLSNISGYFSQTSPYAYQSAQKTQEDQANANANTTTQGINTNQANLTTQEGNAATQETQNEAALKQQLQNQIDAANNTATQQTAAEAPSGGTTSTYTYNPFQIAQNLAPSYYQTVAQGGQQQAQSSANTALTNLGLNPGQVAGLQGYLYGGNGQQGLFSQGSQFGQYYGH